MPSLASLPPEILQYLFEYVFDSTTTRIRTEVFSLWGSEELDSQQKEKRNALKRQSCWSELANVSQACSAFPVPARMAFWNTGTIEFTMDYSFQYGLFLHQILRGHWHFDDIRFMVINTSLEVNDRGFNFSPHETVAQPLSVIGKPGKKRTRHNIALEAMNSIVRHLRALPRLKAAVLAVTCLSVTQGRRTMADLLAAQPTMTFDLSLKMTSPRFCEWIKPYMLATRQAKDTAISACLEWSVYLDGVFCVNCHNLLQKRRSTKGQLVKPWRRCPRCSFGALCSAACYQDVLQWTPLLHGSYCNDDCHGMESAVKEWNYPGPDQPPLHYSDGWFTWV